MPRRPNPHQVQVRPLLGAALFTVYRACCSCRWRSGRYLSPTDAAVSGRAHHVAMTTPAADPAPETTAPATEAPAEVIVHPDEDATDVTVTETPPADAQ